MNPEDPYQVFEEWFGQAQLHEPNDPNAMFLATVDEIGLPNIRVVLMKEYDRSGFVFYTNTQSAKGEELLGSRKATICFEWKSLNRRVVIAGAVETVNNDEADAYFRSRARQSQLGAWASQQSQPLKSKMQLLKRVAKYALKFGASPIPRPDHWTGFRLTPASMEFHDAAEIAKFDHSIVLGWQQKNAPSQLSRQNCREP